MLLSLWTLTVALVLSVIAAYYSVIGLATIFSAAPLPVIIMSAAMEVAKVTTAVWLHRFWSECKWTMKIYLVVAVVTLCSITSMGVFGLLSKAHSDQSLASGNVVAQVDILDEKIKTEKENIESNKQALQQINTTVNETMARSTSEASVGRAVQLRKSQSKEKNELQKQISDAQTRIAALNNERAPLAAQLRKVEAEVGPIKYIAAMIYGDNPDVSTLERAVRWVIVMLVVVFDPLAITLVLAANESLKWTREAKTATVEIATTVEDTPEQAKDEAEVVVTDSVQIKTTDEVAYDTVSLNIEDKLDMHVVDQPDKQAEDEHIEIEDEHIEVDGVKVHAKSASKAWKRLNPQATMKEQFHLLATGEIDCLPWEDPAFIRSNFID